MNVSIALQRHGNHEPDFVEILAKYVRLTSCSKKKIRLKNAGVLQCVMSCQLFLADLPDCISLLPCLRHGLTTHGPLAKLKLLRRCWNLAEQLLTGRACWYSVPATTAGMSVRNPGAAQLSRQRNQLDLPARWSLPRRPKATSGASRPSEWFSRASPWAARWQPGQRCRRDSIE